MNSKSLSYNERFWFSSGHELRVKDMVPTYAFVRQTGCRYYIVSLEQRGDRYILTTRHHGETLVTEHKLDATLPVAPMMPDRNGTPKEVNQ